MFVYKCDKCKKELDQEQKGAALSLSSGKIGLLKDLLLCEKCGREIIKVLKKQKLISQ